MTTRTWVGNGTGNSASDPSAWSPNGVPAAGDTLVMNSGTMNVTGDVLQGDTVTMQPNDVNCTFNLSGASAGLSAVLDSYGQNATINLADRTNWTGGLADYPGCTITVTGASGQWSNTLSNLNGSATIAPAVTGTGTINVNEAHSQGVVEFQGAVGSGQSVTISGYAEYGGQHGIVQVDQPSLYQANTTLGFGELHLQGMTADSYVENGGTLTLYNKGSIVDTLGLTVASVGSGAPQDFGVSQTAAGVVVHTDGTFYGSGGTELPVYESSPQPLSGGSSTVASNTSPSSPSSSGGSSTPPPPTTNTAGGTSDTSQPSIPPTSAGGGMDTSVPPTATVSSAGGTNTASGSDTSTPPTTMNNTTSSSQPPTTTPSASPGPTATIPDNGNTPTPLSPAEVSQQQMVAGLNAHAGAASTLFFDGGHLGTDFDNLGTVLSSGQDATAATNQAITDMRQFLSAWVADPAVSTGFSVPGGPVMAIPGQFVVDVVNAGLKGIVVGSASLDQAYGDALTQFFGGAQSVMVGVGH